jgi:hypothetical protein
MALNIPSFPNPFDASHPLANAYAWISFLALDANAGTGRLVLNVHPNVDAASTSKPVCQLPITLGEVLVKSTSAFDGSTPAVESFTFPSLVTLMSDPEFASAYQTIQAKLEAALIQVPALAGSTHAS